MLKSVTKPFKGAHALILIASVLSLKQEVRAALGGFQSTDGYAITQTITGAGADEVQPNGNTGPEVHTYNAGNGTGTFTNITNNTGLWRELYTARGASQIALGNSTNVNKLGSQTGTGDRAYISAHTAANIAAGVKLPDGKTKAALGDSLLAVRSEAQGFSDGVANPANEGPYNMRFAYTPDSIDFRGRNPTSLIGDETITMTFIAKINIATTDEVSGGLPNPLTLSTFNNANLRPFEMTFGGTISAPDGNGHRTIVNPAFKIGWTDENNFAYWNGGSWVETSYLFDYANFDEVSIRMRLGTDKFDLVVRRQLNNYVAETVATNLSFANNIGTSFGVIGFEMFEDPDNSNATAQGVPKTYLDNVVFSVVPEPSTGLVGLLCALGMVLRRDRRRH